MPELPEVETIRRQLHPVLKGKTLKEIRIKTPRLLQNVYARQLPLLLQNKNVQGVDRQGKYLIFRFTDACLVFHLGMSGIFLLDPRQSRYPQHIHLTMAFLPELHVYYQDVRKFGKIWYYSDCEAFQIVGIDPTSEKFTLNNFKKLLNLSKMNVKNFLMDQNRIAGIGNIYASEILFLAGISPLRRTHELNAQEVASLFQAIPQVLQAAIAHYGTTYSAYRTVEGTAGDHQNFLQVYQRHGQQCRRCGHTIEKIMVGARSTFYCPRCQK